MNDLRYSAKLVFHSDGKFFGPGIVELLQRVQLCHSLHKASKEMSMAYTKALKLVKTAETNLGFKLLNQKIGGISGGGSKLTNEAKKVIELYEAFDDEITTTADKEFEIFKTKIEKMRQT
jgi:molybdate transport system regulatory protein